MRIVMQLLAAVVMAAVPNVLGAQAGDSRETLVVLERERTGPKDQISIYMKPGSTPAAVIAVPTGSTPHDLATAFLLLHRIRKNPKASNTSFAGGALLRVDMPLGLQRKALRDDEKQTYGRYMASLRTARVLDVPGVGEGRAIEVWMPTWR